YPNHLALHSFPTRRSSDLKPEHDIVVHLRLLWEHRRFLSLVGAYAVIASALIAFLIPARYESTARLMPPDDQSASGLATAVAARSEEHTSELQSRGHLVCR